MTIHTTIPAPRAVSRLPRAFRPRGAGPEPLPTDPLEAVILATVRFIAAAYETGDSACWEAAHAHAEAALAAGDAALLVARTAALFRVIRVDRPDFGVLPPSSRWMSADEMLLLHLVRAARTEIRSGWCSPASSRCAAAILDTAGAIRLLASTAASLADAAERAVDQYRSKLPDQMRSKQEVS